jgi:hypothetical protein
VTAPDRAPGPADPVGDPADPLEERRRVALEKAVSEARAASAYRGPGVLSVGFRCFSPGRLAVALVGAPDDEGLARLYALSRYLDRLASDELVVDLAGFRGSSRALLRVVNELRGTGRGARRGRRRIVLRRGPAG